MPSDPPNGFYVLDPDDPFEMETGPFYARDGEGDRLYGFRMEGRHANAGGAIHGGALMTFADFAICAEAVRGHPEDAPLTISFASEFLAPVHTGAWIETRPDVLRRTRGFVFMRAVLQVEDTPVFSCSGVIKRLTRERKGTGAAG
jgi:acyl-coenzyme A thioesterase PaaI-like protein